MNLLEKLRPVGLFYLLIAFCFSSVPAFAKAESESHQVYQKHCASCHGVKRYGGTAPPLIPASLKKLSAKRITGLIKKGLPSTQMPPFKDVLNDAQIAGLIQYIKSPSEKIRWGLYDILKSRVTFPVTEAKVPADFDRQKTVLVVERGTRSISVLNGETLEEFDKFNVGKIHGGPKFDKNYDHIFAATRDGIVTVYNLKKGYPVAQARAAVNSRNIAVSPKGDYLAIANLLPQNLTLLDNKLNPIRVIPLPGKPSGVYQLPDENAFILAFRNLPKLFIIRYPTLEIEEITLEDPFEDFMFVPGRQQLFASSRKGKAIYLYDLEKRKTLHSLPIDGFPHLFSATYFKKEGVLYAALNHMRVPRLSIINMENLTIAKKIPLKKSGYFVRTHPTSPYIWVDTNTEDIQLVDKESFQLVEKSLKPAAGKKAMHIEFDLSGQKALVSIWDKDGGVVIYDSKSLKEIERIPYNMPIGKYNAYNKTHFPL